MGLAMQMMFQKYCLAQIPAQILPMEAWRGGASGCLAGSISWLDQLKQENLPLTFWATHHKYDTQCMITRQRRFPTDFSSMKLNK